MINIPTYVRTDNHIFIWNCIVKLHRRGQRNSSCFVRRISKHEIFLPNPTFCSTYESAQHILESENSELIRRHVIDLLQGSYSSICWILYYFIFVINSARTEVDVIILNYKNGTNVNWLEDHKWKKMDCQTSDRAHLGLRIISYWSLLSSK